MDGKADTLQQILLRLGRQRLGPPTNDVQSNILAITDLERLERMTEQLLVVPSWRELLETP